MTPNEFARIQTAVSACSLARFTNILETLGWNTSDIIEVRVRAVAALLDRSKGKQEECALTSQELDELLDTAKLSPAQSR